MFRGTNLPYVEKRPCYLCGNKMPTRCNRRFLLQILLIAQHVSGTIMPIIRSSRVLYSWLLAMVFGALVFKLSVWCGAEGYVSGLRAAAAYRQLENQSTKYHRQQPNVKYSRAPDDGHNGA